MRVLRVLVGILVSLVALPIIAAGGVAWWAMQHRSPDGSFQATLAPIETSSRIVVVPDVDAVLHRDAPIARADQTELRLTAPAGSFIGMASPADLAVFLTGVDYTELTGAKLGRGPLAAQTRSVTSAGEPLGNPAEQGFWTRNASTELRWTPADDRDGHIALIVIAPVGEDPVMLSVAVTAGWLSSTAWGLLILGPVLLLLGLAALAWPQRPREIVYVVDAATAANAGLPAPTAWHTNLPAPSTLDRPAAVPRDIDSTEFWPFAHSDTNPARAAASASDGAPSASAACADLEAAPASADAASGDFAERDFAEGDEFVERVGMPAAGRQPRVEARAGGRLPAVVSQRTDSIDLPAEADRADAEADLVWPPAEGPDRTEPVREVPTQEMPIVGADRPMPTAGMHLHLSRK